MIKGAIWDMDGTLLDSMKLWDHLASDYIYSLGKVPEDNLEEVLFSLSMEKGAEYLKEAYRLELDVPRIIDGINEAMARFYRDEVELKPGALQLLKAMDEAGIQLTVATSTDRQHIEAALKRLDVLKYFKTIYTCSEIGVGKVKPDIYLKAAEDMGTLPEETLVLEDAYHAALTAKRAGFVIAGVYDASSASYQEDVRDICDVYIKEFISLENIINNL